MLDHHFYGEQNGQHQIGCLHAARKELFSVQPSFVGMQPENSCVQCNWCLLACSQTTAVFSPTGARLHAAKTELMSRQSRWCLHSSAECVDSSSNNKST